MGLHLGMELPGWPPENVEELSRGLGMLAPRVLLNKTDANDAEGLAHF
jgi:hypothetical protein